jgi:hypothetical protein
MRDSRRLPNARSRAAACEDAQLPYGTGAHFLVLLPPSQVSTDVMQVSPTTSVCRRVPAMLAPERSMPCPCTWCLKRFGWLELFLSWTLEPAGRRVGFHPLEDGAHAPISVTTRRLRPKGTSRHPRAIHDPGARLDAVGHLLRARMNTLAREQHGFAGAVESFVSDRRVHVRELELAIRRHRAPRHLAAPRTASNRWIHDVRCALRRASSASCARGLPVTRR